MNEDARWLQTVTFDSGAPAYTYDLDGNQHELDAIAADFNEALINNSSSTQTVEGNGGVLLVSGVIAANSGDVVVNSAMKVGSGSSNSARWVDVEGSHDVYFNGEWTGSVSGSMYNSGRGRFFMDHTAGTAYMGDIGTEYKGTFVIDTDMDGALRLTHDNALGYAGSDNNPAIQVWGGETYNGTVELSGGISTGRQLVFLNGRTGAVADDPHFRNVDGDNTFNVGGDWNTGLSSLYSGADPTHPGNINLKSDSGKFTITGGPVYNTQAGDPSAWKLVLAGDGDGEIQSQVTYYQDNPGFDLVKKGGGTWTLSNANNDYTGTTTVMDGTLVVNGSHTGGGAYTIEAGGTLGGSGTTDAPIDLLGAIAPGTSPGTLTVGALTINDGSSLNFELDPSDNMVGDDVNDLIDVTGELDLSAATASMVTLNLEDVGGGDFSGVGTWTLITYDSVNEGSFNAGDTVIAGLGSGLTGQVVLDTDNNAVLLVTAEVPEPSGLLLGCISALVMLSVRSRQQQLL